MTQGDPMKNPAASAATARRSIPFAWLIGVGVAFTLVLGACIKRQPLPAEAPTATAAASASAAAPRAPAAPTEPTGNWGKVPGTSLIGPGGIREFQVHGQTDKVRLAVVKVDGEGFDEAARAVVLRSSANAWDVQLQTKTVAPVAKGDVILATFTFRVTETETEGGDGDTEFVFELGREPWTKSVSFPVRGGKEWRTVRVPFLAGGDFAAGEAQAIFRLGYAPQTIEIGGVTLESFGKQLALADLPKTSPTYRGMSADAAWRAAAEQRIEQHRKAALKVVVRDRGKAVPGAEVHATLRRHAFEFGTCATAARLLDASDPRYLETLAELFNSVTLEDDLEWRALAGEFGPGYTAARTRAAIDLLASRKIAVRGRALVRPAWDSVPAALRELRGKAPELRAEVDRHVREVLGTLGKDVRGWGVVDLPYDRRDLMALVGPAALGDWFKAARSAAPEAELLLDTTGVLGTGPLPDRQRSFAEATFKGLLAAGAPVDALGIQAQYVSKLTSPEEIVATLDRFGSHGKPIVVTRFDPLIDEDELAAQYLRDFYLAVFSSPAAKGIVLWGFWDRAHWRNRAALYRYDWSLKPAGTLYRELVLGRWRTDAQGSTDAQGTFTTAGFLGEYTVSVRAGDRTVTREGSLLPGGSTLEIDLGG